MCCFSFCRRTTCPCGCNQCCGQNRCGCVNQWDVDAKLIHNQFLIVDCAEKDVVAVVAVVSLYKNKPRSSSRFFILVHQLKLLSLSRRKSRSISCASLASSNVSI